jgi:hypothetical protein
MALLFTTIDGDDAVGGALSTTVDDETVADVTVSVADAGLAQSMASAHATAASVF